MRDVAVTGVQSCALPISSALRPPRARKTPNRERPRHSRNSLPSRIHSTSSFAGLYLRLSAASHAGSCCFHWGFVGGSAGGRERRGFGEGVEIRGGRFNKK